MYKLSKRSLNKLSTCHEDLQILAKEAIKNSPYDFGITHGHRIPDEQRLLFKKGRNSKLEIVDKSKVVTYVDGYIKKSKHNAFPSEAFDIVCYINGEITWSPAIYLEVAEHIIDVAEELFEKGLITNRIVYGGYWKKFRDYPHFQI